MEPQARHTVKTTLSHSSRPIRGGIIWIGIRLVWHSLSWWMNTPYWNPISKYLAWFICTTKITTPTLRVWAGLHPTVRHGNTHTPSKIWTIESTQHIKVLFRNNQSPSCHKLWSHQWLSMNVIWGKKKNVFKKKNTGYRYWFWLSVKQMLCQNKTILCSPRNTGIRMLNINNTGIYQY